MNYREFMIHDSIIPFIQDPIGSISDLIQNISKDPLTFLIVGTVAFIAIMFFHEYSSWGRIPNKV